MRGIVPQLAPGGDPLGPVDDGAIARASEGLLGVDPMRVATRTISALADGASTGELAQAGTALYQLAPAIPISTPTPAPEEIPRM